MASKRDVLQREAGRIGLDLSDPQIATLLRYAELLATRGVEIGAVGRRDRDRMLERHILDSLRAAPEVRDTDRIAYDLGSGGGLPGIPVAIVRPWSTVVLVESRHWRAGFLEMVVAELDLNVRVERARAEAMAVQADVAFSRAFAPLAKAWGLARPLLKPGGRLVFFSGARGEDLAGEAGRLAGEGHVTVRPDVLERGGPLLIIERP